MTEAVQMITAFAEEIAWRGFLLERLPFKKIKSVLFVGAQLYKKSDKKLFT